MPPPLSPGTADPVGMLLDEATCMSIWQRTREQIRRAARTFREVLYGMTTYDWAQSLRHTRGEVERLFVLSAFGDLIGLPIMPPYYTLRLLPYIVPALDRWKRGLLRQRDWTDLTELIEGID